MFHTLSDTEVSGRDNEVVATPGQGGNHERPELEEFRDGYHGALHSKGGLMNMECCDTATMGLDVDVGCILIKMIDLYCHAVDSHLSPQLFTFLSICSSGGKILGLVHLKKGLFFSFLLPFFAAGEYKSPGISPGYRA